MKAYDSNCKDLKQEVYELLQALDRKDKPVGYMEGFNDCLDVICKVFGLKK